MIAPPLAARAPSHSTCPRCPAGRVRPRLQPGERVTSRRPCHLDYAIARPRSRCPRACEISDLVWRIPVIEDPRHGLRIRRHFERAEAPGIEHGGLPKSPRMLAARRDSVHHADSLASRALSAILTLCVEASVPSDRLVAAKSCPDS